MSDITFELLSHIKMISTVLLVISIFIGIFVVALVIAIFFVIKEAMTSDDSDEEDGEVDEHGQKQGAATCDTEEKERLYRKDGELMLDQGQNLKVISLFKEQIEILPECADSHYVLGLAFYKTENFEQSLMHYEKAMSLEPYYQDFLEYQVKTVKRTVDMHVDCIKSNEKNSSNTPKSTACDERTLSINPLKSLETRLNCQIIGQQQPIHDICMVLKNNLVYAVKDKPIASLMLTGATGVGKTETALKLAKALQMPIKRVDMSEYGYRGSVSGLIGTTAGWTGYGDGGLITNFIKDNPRCVLLLDEIEKAHSSVHNLLLQALDYGKLTSGEGKQVCFSQVIIIMTTNAVRSRSSIGFNSSALDTKYLDTGLKQHFSSEFINRFDLVTHFSSLNSLEYKQIIGNKLREDVQTIKTRFDVDIVIDGVALALFIEQIYQALKRDVVIMSARQIGPIIKQQFSRYHIPEQLIYEGLTPGSKIIFRATQKKRLVYSREQCAH